MSKKHLFDDQVPTPELAANRYAAVMAINLTDPPHPVAHENFMKMIAKVRADALRSFADELEANLTVTSGSDDALTIGVLRERADEVEEEA